MRYIKVIIRCTTSASELVAQVLEDNGCKGAVIEDKNDIDLSFPADTWAIAHESLKDSMESAVKVSGFLPEGDGKLVDAIKTRMNELKEIDLGGIDLGMATVETEVVNEEDWANNWKQYYKPLKIGEKFVIKPSWEEYLPGDGDVVIELDPGMAFGTGTHETTALCLRIIEKSVKPGMRVFDAGCGSGILSMGAALLGAEVLAIDIDPVAVGVAGENIRKAGLSDRVVTREGNLLKENLSGYNIVVANIIADVLIAGTKAIKNCLVSGGKVIASGIIADREADVVKAFMDAGLNVDRVSKDGEWVAILAEKSGES